jgi:hypothetical protein
MDGEFCISLSRTDRKQAVGMSVAGEKLVAQKGRRACKRYLRPPTLSPKANARPFVGAFARLLIEPGRP